MQEIGICEVGGFRIGHAHDEQAATGCTVILCDECAPAGVDIRGGGPASRETPLLNPVAMAEGIHAVLLSGGSAFGLDAAGGVMQYLEERKIGFDVGVTRVPLVCQSCVFDLVIGRTDVRPDKEMAYRACENAGNGEVEEGCVGAGMGCTVGKYRGKDYAMKSGLGTFAVQVGKVKVGAIVALNAMGDVYDIDTGVQIAGLLNETRDGLRSTEQEMLADVAGIHNLFTGNTTIGAIVTNGAFTKAEMNKIASMAHNGYARAIRPVHTTADGDSIYALSTGHETADLNVVGTLAAYVMGRAIGRAARAAHSMDGYLSAQELKK
ncbi:MAG: P1 family peptidase [Clostridiaceae bacterium]|nr:P1 family peptidase [Clostridiaceae bacterium]